MPNRDGTGPAGAGRGFGRGAGRGFGGGRGFGRGPSGSHNLCRCPKCGHTQPHIRGMPCSQVKCEVCGAYMVPGD